MRYLSRTLPLALAILFVPMQALAQHAIGHWHGTISTPVGDLTLVVRIETDQAGTLSGTLESVDQAPGRLIPLTSVEATQDTMSFTLAPANARYEGRWKDGQWEGTFTQGMDMPLVLRPGLPEAGKVVAGLDGIWKGTIHRNGVELRLIVHVASTEQAGTVARLDSPDLGAVGIPIANLSLEGDALAFDVPAASAAYRATRTGEDRWEGIWSVPNQLDAPVVFERSTEAARPLRRPQHPDLSNVPYRVIEVAFENVDQSGVRLAGTLTLPEGAGPFPAAVLITGSGPQDRDQTLFGHKPFLVIADALTNAGIAVLRYDDRGVGQSTGTFAGATSEDFAQDAQAAIGFLRQREDIGPIGLVGHSEGGLVAALVAARADAGRGPDYLVLLAGPGTDMVGLLLAQNRLVGLSQGISKAEVARREPVIEGLMRAVASSQSEEDAQGAIESMLTTEALEALGATEAQRPFVAASLTGPWIRWLLAHNPAETLARVRVPVLALNGSLDVQVPAGPNLAAIRAALAENTDATTREIPGLNHLFQPAATGALGEYADIETTFDPDTMTLVATWINDRFAR